MKDAFPAVPFPPNSKLCNLAGKTFGRWLVAYFAGWDQKAHAQWLCVCQNDGNTKAIDHYNLISGKTTSCGCRRDEVRTSLRGMSGGTLYHTWGSMKQRCYSKNSPAYANYGGRGITVCKRWRESFLSFHDDMGDRPSRNHSLDRLNNFGGYWCGRRDVCPECKRKNWPANVAWRTADEQIANRRITIWLEKDGTKLTLRQWASKLGMKYNTLHGRYQAGMAIEDILAGPEIRLHRNGHWLIINGVRMSATDAAKQYGVPDYLVFSRLYNGWTPEEAVNLTKRPPRRFSVPPSPITHGGSYTVEYGAWKRMIQFCYNPDHKLFASYGGSGATVCDQWRNSFATFRDDMGQRPPDCRRLMRKNNSRPFSSSNCLWGKRKTRRGQLA